MPKTQPIVSDHMTALHIVEHGFPELEGAVENPTLSAESDAALRQLTLQRLLGYGVEYGDATRVRHAVSCGIAWSDACVAVADSVLAKVALAGVPQSAATERARLYRASALLRMSQIMMPRDNDERRALYRRAAQLFEAAGRDRWTKTLIHYGSTHLVGWFLPARLGQVERTVLVIGGIEGWGMDWLAIANMFAEKGIAVFLLDGPGQGESRFEHGVYLTHNWRDAYAAAFDYLADQVGARSLGMLGNSMGGNFAIMYAAQDKRIRACCDNGGIRVPLMQKARRNFFYKMETFCDPRENIDELWAAMEITSQSVAATAPFLVIQGGADPLVSTPDAEMILTWSRSSDKQMHIFEKSDHCIYDKPADKNDVITDWFASRLP